MLRSFSHAMTTTKILPVDAILRDGASVEIRAVTAEDRPHMAVKSGRPAAGTRAASSHSAALASLDVGIDALFAQAGVIRTDTLEQLFDVVALLSSQPVPGGTRVGVVTNAGGPGILHTAPAPSPSMPACA